MVGAGIGLDQRFRRADDLRHLPRVSRADPLPWLREIRRGGRNDNPSVAGLRP
jgi:hypothetical protein